jgi:hypothetical protein
MQRGDGQFAVDGDRHRKTGSESPDFVTRWRAEFPDEASCTEVNDSLIDSGHVRVGLNITGLQPSATELQVGQADRGRPLRAGTVAFRRRGGTQR